jgi:hypothetical protein
MGKELFGTEDKWVDCRYCEKWKGTENVLLAIGLADTPTTEDENYIFYFVKNFLRITARISILMSILGAFAKLQKATVSSVMSVCLSVSMEQLRSN